MVRCFGDFVEVLLESGFSIAWGGTSGIYAIIPWGWGEPPPYETPVEWHTDTPETDPWEWRMRVLEERTDIAYAKVFFKKSGFITKEWYPYFLAARRGGLTFDEAYEDGTISHYAKRVYDVVAENGALATHTIKQMAGFSKENKSGFDRALTELQMGMYLTVCGRQQKASMLGRNIAWASTVMTTTEDFFGEAVFVEADKIAVETAYEKIRDQVLKLNPSAQENRIERFVYG